MKTSLEIEDIQAIASAVIETLRPLLTDREPMEIVPHDRHFNVMQLSEYMGMSAQWIYNNIKSLPHFNLNRKPLFRRSEMDAWLEKYRVRLENADAAVKPSSVNRESEGNMKIGSFKQKRAVTSC